MSKYQPAPKIRIKDIAEKAGTSIGTVDRVLHGRPNVSEEVRKRVEQAIKDLNYEPNRYASALAFNKRYQFVAFFPSPKIDPYWKELSLGIQDAISDYRDFNLSIEELYYETDSPNSYNDGLKQILDKNPDGVIMAPQLTAITYTFCQQLKQQGIPVTFVDSNIHDLDALTFYGQASLMSGRFAARMSVLEAAPERQFLIILFDLPSLQQYNRQLGFKEYIRENYPDYVIHEMTINLKDANMADKLNAFRMQHPDVHFICTFCSLSHIIADYIAQNHISDWHMMGYDMLDANVQYLKQGIIRFLIAQHPWQQGYGCVDALFNHIILKKQIKRLNYMPIELLTAENCDYYLKNAKTTY